MACREATPWPTRHAAVGCSPMVDNFDERGSFRHGHREKWGTCEKVGYLQRSVALTCSQVVMWVEIPAMVILRSWEHQWFPYLNGSPDGGASVDTLEDNSHSYSLIPALAYFCTLSCFLPETLPYFPMKRLARMRLNRTFYGKRPVFTIMSTSDVSIFVSTKTRVLGVRGHPFNTQRPEGKVQMFLPIHPPRGETLRVGSEVKRWFILLVKGRFPRRNHC